MERINKKNKTIPRKKFFTSIGTGLLGLVVFNSVPFAKRLNEKKTEEVVVKINPLAVKRNKLGGNNA